MTSIEERDDSALHRAVSQLAEAGGTPDDIKLSRMVEAARTRGRKRTRVRRGLVTVGSMLCIAGISIFAWSAASPDNHRVLTPAATSAVPTTEGFVMPTIAAKDGSAPDLPGDDGYDWRGQVREAVRTYPGVLALPTELPSDISSMRAAAYGDLAALDFFQDGPGVVVCSGDSAECGVELQEWAVLRQGQIGTQNFTVLVSPPGNPDSIGLTDDQRAYWTTVEFTAQVPAYLTS